jgi:hypothetical protein
MGLNHMNGRVQDAISGTFLSPDPYIPDPLNTQAFNRYAYVYNNPLTYTDPSGFKPSWDESPCQPFDLGCGGFIPGGFLLGPGTAGNEYLACFARGDCRGTSFGQNYNPKVAPQTAIVQMDKRPVAKASSTNGGMQNCVFTAGVMTCGVRNEPLTEGELRSGASMFVGALPWVGSGQSVVELASGRDYITGEKASRWLAGAGLVAGLIPFGKTAVKWLARVGRGADETVSVFHGSIKDGAQILERGLDPARAPTFVSRDVAAAQDALLNHPDAVPGLGKIIESRIPASQFDRLFAPLERPYDGFFPYPLKSTEITLRTGEQIDLFNQYIVR